MALDAYILKKNTIHKTKDVIINATVLAKKKKIGKIVGMKRAIVDSRNTYAD